ncbi:MAG: hypothetical protein OER83_08015 [Flavobacteriaceae bacterium]|nr:hypothetical protein [Flavobacteriaceae bacterium]
MAYINCDTWTVPTSDFPPADAHLEGYELLRERLNNSHEEFNAIRSGPIAEPDELV